MQKKIEHQVHRVRLNNNKAFARAHRHRKWCWRYVFAAGQHHLVAIVLWSALLHCVNEEQHTWAKTICAVRNAEFDGLEKSQVLAIRTAFESAQFE